MDKALYELAQRVGRELGSRHLKLATAESCTGGGIAYVLTEIAGSSAWYERGFVTYSNAAKQDMLRVDPQTLTLHGAVSEATALEMAAGAQRHSAAQVSLAVTGVAGPGGGSADKPVGMVCFAWAIGPHAPTAETHYFEGDRAQVRCMAIVTALDGLLARLD